MEKENSWAERFLKFCKTPSVVAFGVAGTALEIAGLSFFDHPFKFTVLMVAIFATRFYRGK